MGHLEDAFPEATGPLAGAKFVVSAARRFSPLRLLSEFAGGLLQPAAGGGEVRDRQPFALRARERGSWGPTGPLCSTL